MPTTDEESPITGEERSLALNIVLSNAADMGIDAALQQFGSPLTDTEKAAVKALSKDDIVALRQVSGKLGSLSPLAATNNNNNNNNKPR